MASRSLTNGKDVQSIAESLQGRSPTLAPSSARRGGHVSQALYVKTSNRHLYIAGRISLCIQILT